MTGFHHYFVLHLRRIFCQAWTWTLLLIDLLSALTSCGVSWFILKLQRVSNLWHSILCRPVAQNVVSYVSGCFGNSYYACLWYCYFVIINLYRELIALHTELPVGEGEICIQSWGEWRHGCWGAGRPWMALAHWDPCSMEGRFGRFAEAVLWGYGPRGRFPSHHASPYSKHQPQCQLPP